MSSLAEILVSARRAAALAGVAALVVAATACGQRGPLYLPKTPAAQQRATLPQTVFGTGRQPALPASAAASAPVPAASAPAPAPAPNLPLPSLYDPMPSGFD